MLFLVIHYFWYPVTKSRKQKDRRGALVFDRYPGWCLGARRWAGTWWSFHGASADVGFHQRQNNHRVVTVRPKYWNWQRVPVWAPPKTWVETRSTPRESTVECNSFKTCYKDTIAKANRRNEARASWHCGHWSCQCFFGVTPEACTKTQMSQTKHSAKKKNQPAEVSCHQGDELCLFGEGFQFSFNALSKNRCIRCVWFECACFCKIPKTCPTTHNPIYVYFHTNPSLIL